MRTAQIGGFQGNGTIQGAGALQAAAGPERSVLSLWRRPAMRPRSRGNGAHSNNESNVNNTLDTGDAIASNDASLDVKQSNKNTGWAAGVAAIDLIGVGVGFIYQSNFAASATRATTRRSPTRARTSRARSARAT